MKLIGLEEHFVTPEVLAAWRALAPRFQDVALQHSDGGEIGDKLCDLADRRIADMDETGLDVQVLSLTAPGLQSLEAEEALALQATTNDLIAETVRLRPDRFQGFATLATPDPRAAARELERAVIKLGLNGAMLFGRTRERNLDHPDNWPILSPTRDVASHQPWFQPRINPFPHSSSTTCLARSRDAFVRRPSELPSKYNRSGSDMTKRSRQPASLSFESNSRANARDGLKCISVITGS